MENQKETKYRELYRILKGRINKGEYIPGSILPSENELKQTYNVTQPTIRHALDMLVEERLIRKHQGKGSIVQPKPMGVGIITFEGYSVTSQNDNVNITTRIISGPEIGNWPVKIAFKPEGVESMAKVIRIERIRSFNSDVVFYEKIHIPNIQMEGFCSQDLNNVSLYDILNLKYGVRVRSSEQKIWVISCDRQIAKLLQINVGEPVLHMDRRLGTNLEGFNIYSSLWVNTGKYMLYSLSQG